MVALNRIRVVAVVSALLVVLLPGTDGANKYCRICKYHTRCIYQGFGSACSKVLAKGTTKEDRNAIVGIHNSLRNLVASGSEHRGRPGPQPSAADMNALVWDNELANIAQRWADQCTFEHDAYRDVRRFHVGQNLFIHTTTGTIGKADWKEAIEAWYEEVTDFNKNHVYKYKFSSGTGHYSQLVWGNTRHVGCGRTVYRGPNGRKNDLYACNYGPTGNYISSPVYTVGRSCSKCSGKCHSTYTSLCA